MTFDREKYKDFARQQISGRRKNASLAVLTVVLITLLFSIPESRINYSWEEIMAASTSWTDLVNYFNSNSQTTPLAFLFSFIQTIIGFITQIALASFFLAYSRSPEPVSLKVFFEGFNKWGRGILTGLWQLLWYVIWVIAITVIGIAAMIPLFLILPDTLESFELVYLLSMLLAIVCSKSFML